MKEKLYAIPVNDGFDSGCECPVCAMRSKLEADAVDYTMGPSYMEDDTRALTDELGFCKLHAQAVYDKENRLGMALVLKTHFDKVIRDISGLEGEPAKAKGFFKKEVKVANPVSEYVNKLNSTCFVCNRIDNVFDRYVDTIFYLWKSDADFKKKFAECNGFCTEHFGLLYEQAGTQLSKDALDEFLKLLKELYIKNMARVRDDLEWFINKFDYKYANEPWKNARDSIQRAMVKTNGIVSDNKENK